MKNIIEILEDEDLTENQKLEQTKIAIDNGADVNVKNKEGYTPLHRACIWGYLNIAKLLIENKADVNIKTNRGSASLHFACSWGYLNIVKLLIENSADVNAKWAPLHISCSGDVINLSKTKYTPLEIAEKYNRTEIVNYLTKK
jgi:ankyrin repeat protein